MVRRKRRGTQEGEYQDPLKDYSPATYADELERSLCESDITEMEIKPFLAIDPGTSVEETMRLMDKIGIACLVVTEGDKLVGIFSERDILNKVAEQYEQIKDGPVRDVMTPNPVSVYETDSPAQAMNLMAVSGFRHIPILDLDENVVGILGPRRVTAFVQKHFEEA